MWRDVRTWLSCAGCLALVACWRPNPAYDPGALREDGPPADRADARPPDATALIIDGPAVRLDAPATTPDTAPSPIDAPPDRSSLQAPDTTINPALAVGLIGYWNMDEVAGSPTAHDRSGNGNDGTLEVIAPASAWVAGHNGATALAIAGGTDRTVGVRVPNNAAISAIQHFTVAAWFYDTDTSMTNFRGIISRQIDGTDSELFYLGVVRGYLKIYVPRPTTAGSYAATSPQLSPHNRWAHAAATYDGTYTRLYLDGVEVDNVKYVEPFPSATTPLYLGTNKNVSNAGEPFVGDLDDVVLYNRALTVAEIQMLANGQHP
jgi:hypothetical protein